MSRFNSTRSLKLIHLLLLERQQPFIGSSKHSQEVFNHMLRRITFLATKFSKWFKWLFNHITIAINWINQQHNLSLQIQDPFAMSVRRAKFQDVMFLHLFYVLIGMFVMTSILGNGASTHCTVVALEQLDDYLLHLLHWSLSFHCNLCKALDVLKQMYCL